MDSLTRKTIDAVVLVDDNTNYQAILNAISSLSESPTLLPAGSGLAHGCQFTLGTRHVHVLSIADEPGHPFVLLALQQLALRRTVGAVLAISTANSLVDYLSLGDLTVVTKATALPYPALYQNQDPYSNLTDSIESHQINSTNLDQFNRFLSMNLSSITWQEKLPEVHSGYTKHPVLGGGLPPWAGEQFEQLRSFGITTYSEMPVAVYEAQTVMPETSFLCINQIRSNPSADSPKYWNRHQQKLTVPLVRLVAKWLQGNNKS